MLLLVPRQRHKALLLHSPVPTAGLASASGNLRGPYCVNRVKVWLNDSRSRRESRQSRTKSASSTCRASTPDSKPLTTPLAVAAPGPKPSTERSAPARSGQECRASAPDPKPSEAPLALAKSGPKRATKPSAPARSGKGRRASTPASEVIVAVENTLDDMRRKNYRPGLMEPDFVRFLLTVRRMVGQPRGPDGMP